MRTAPVAAHRPLVAALAVLALAGCGVAPVPPAPVAREPEHLERSIAAVGWPGARGAFMLGPGAAAWNGVHALRWRVGDGGGGAQVSPVWFEADGVPVAHWWITTARESVAFEAAAVPRVSGADSTLELSVHATSTWIADAPGTATLDAALSSAADVCAAWAWDAPDAPEPLHWEGRVAQAGGRAVAWAPEGAECSGEGGTLQVHATAALRRGQSAAWTFVLPLAARAAGDRAAPREHADACARARTFWRESLARGAHLASGDPALDALERAARVTLLACIEREPEGRAVVGSPFQYRDLWLRDGARAVRALALCGYTDEAREAADVLLRFQWPYGALLSQRGQLDGTGQALWALEQAASHPPDAKQAKAWLVPALRGVVWLRSQCDQTRALGLPWPGLLPYGDPHDGELVCAPLVGNDAWAIAGEEAASRLATLAGDGEAAAGCRTTALAHRAAFDAALARVAASGLPPSWPGPGRDWGNYAVAFPTGVLSPTHPRVRALLARVGAASPGLATYGGPDSLHSYLGADLAVTAMLAGDRGAARAYLDSLRAHSSSTLGQAELFARSSGGFGRNLPPHATAAAAVVELTHALFVIEHGDTLVVAAGLDEAGWRRTPTFSAAPTRFGVLEMSFGGVGSDGVRVSLHGVTAPVKVRLPEGCTLASGPAGARDRGDGWVVSPTAPGDFMLKRAAGGAR